MKNILKSTIYIFLFIFSIGITAQIEKGFNLSLSSGITMPIGDYQKYTKDGEIVDIGFPLEFYGYSKERTGKFQFNIDATYQFGSLGAGISYGQFTHEISTLKYDINLPTLIKGGDIKGDYYGLGPNYGFSLGKLGLVTSFRVGMMNLDIADFKGSYNGDDTVEPITIISTTINSEANETLMYSSFGVKLSYPVINNLNLFIKGDYFTTFGDGVKVDDNFYLPFDMDNNQEITIADVEHFTLIDYEKNESRYIKPQMFNIGLGLSYTFHPKPKKINKTSITKKPEKEETKETKIILTYPENNAQFSEGKTFKNFKWKVTGKKFNNPKYVIEVIPVGEKKGTLIAFSPKEDIDFKQVFKEISPNGLYSWRVVEQNSGISSNRSSFTHVDCVIHMYVKNVEAECLGYVGSDRKFKICFDIQYDSQIGDLAYNNAGSGLSVYDQAYTTLTYNLVSPNTTLITQVGASITTVHYCFEALVDSNVSEIGFSLKGDDLDPNPRAECKPGVSNGVDELPSCLCDECDDISIDFNSNSVTQTNDPSIFTLDGSIAVNQPIYGVEFQIVSMNYSSSPNACSNGVTSVEESGMFLQAGTTINNSTSIQFNNENASQSPNSNNNASKNIKYTTSSALNGSTPFSLNIGLPQPLQGLNSGCCQIDYEVCIKANVFYEDGTCKTCTITKCFNFNNQ